MNRSFKQGVDSSKRASAYFAAALIVFLQLVGAAHFHNGPFGGHREARVLVAASSDQCTVCVLALHAPAAAAPVTSVPSPAPVCGEVLFRQAHEPSVAFLDSKQGRAPPVLL
jgi:hypothetical protein